MNGKKKVSLTDCAVCFSGLSRQNVCTLPCAHHFHLHCITAALQHGNRFCPLCRSTMPPSLANAAPLPKPLAVANVDIDDEELILLDFPPRSPSSSSPSPVTAAADTFPELDPVTIETFTEYPAVAADASPTNFAVLVRACAPAAVVDGRVPIDLIVVLDVSGSMEGCKLTLLKLAACFLIDTLGASDCLSIVTFSTNADCVLDLCYMSDDGRVMARRAIDSLIARGETNIRAGLDTAVRVLADRDHRNPVEAILLLSDGQDNQNNISISYHNHQGQQENYIRLLPTHMDVPTIHTFGLGADHDPRAMHAISSATGGTFSFIEVDDDIQNCFATSLGGLLSVTSQQLDITLNSSSSNVRIISVASGSYNSTINNSGLTAAIHIGELYADEDKNFLLHLSVPAVHGWYSEQWTELLTAKCTYINPLTGEVVSVEGEPTVIRRPINLLPEDRRVNPILDGQRNRIMAAEDIKKAYDAAERGELETAQAIIDNQRSVIGASPSSLAGNEICSWLDDELREIHTRMGDSRVYGSSWRAYSLSGLSSHQTQRAVAGAVAGQARKFAAASVNGPGVSGCWPMDCNSGRVGYQTRAVRDMVIGNSWAPGPSSEPFGSRFGRVLNEGASPAQPSPVQVFEAGSTGLLMSFRAGSVLPE